MFQTMLLLANLQEQYTSVWCVTTTSNLDLDIQILFQFLVQVLVFFRFKNKFIGLFYSAELGSSLPPHYNIMLVTLYVQGFEPFPQDGDRVNSQKGQLSGQVARMWSFISSMPNNI